MGSTGVQPIADNFAERCKSLPKYNFISRGKGAFDAKLVQEIADFVS